MRNPPKIAVWGGKELYAKGPGVGYIFPDILMGSENNQEGVGQHGYRTSITWYPC